MSSTCLPSIELECRPPRAVRAAIVCGVGAAALSCWLASPTLLMALIATAAAGLALAACATGGWLGGPQMLRTVTWNSAGEWWLAPDLGEPVRARLVAGRLFARWLWLRWDSPAGRRQAILFRHSPQSDGIRRLAARLRLAGAVPPDRQP